jgi:hypothetical protein
MEDEADESDGTADVKMAGNSCYHPLAVEVKISNHVDVLILLFFCFISGQFAYQLAVTFISTPSPENISRIFFLVRGTFLAIQHFGL